MGFVCYNTENEIKRSSGVVQFHTGGDAATADKPASSHTAFVRHGQIRCDSGADGTVRMKEELAQQPFYLGVRITYSIFLF